MGSQLCRNARSHPEPTSYTGGTSSTSQSSDRRQCWGPMPSIPIPGRDGRSSSASHILARPPIFDSDLLFQCGCHRQLCYRECSGPNHQALPAASLGGVPLVGTRVTRRPSRAAPAQARVELPQAAGQEDLPKLEWPTRASSCAPPNLCGPRGYCH